MTRCPDLPELEMLLDHADPPSNLLAHLDQCADCRHTLEFLAGEERFWKAASSSLRQTPDAQPLSGEVKSKLLSAVCALPPHPAEELLCAHEETQLQQMLEPPSHPELLGRLGRYEIEQLVGRGGMGLVFRGFDTELHRVVAIKTLAVHLMPIPSARERFEREGRACASLIHPHIVTIHDVVTEESVPALVMQYVPGPSLAQRLRDRGPLCWRQAIELTIQLLDALAVAHENGLVHRDIKPGNVLLEAEASRALLSDFGLVRALDEASLTHSGLLAGTPDYMSPEQTRGEPATSSSDLFSVGSLLYAMVTGQPPFQADSPMAVLGRISQHPHAPLALEEAPAGLSLVVDRLLAKQPDDRYDSARSARADLARVLRGERPLARRSSSVGKVSAAQTMIILAIVATMAASFFIRPNNSWSPGMGATRSQSRESPQSLASPELQQQLQESRMEYEAAATAMREIDQELVNLDRAAETLLDNLRASTDTDVAPARSPSAWLEALDTRETERTVDRLLLELEQNR